MTDQRETQKQLDAVRDFHIAFQRCVSLCMVEPAFASLHEDLNGIVESLEEAQCGDRRIKNAQDRWGVVRDRVENVVELISEEVTAHDHDCASQVAEVL